MVEAAAKRKLFHAGHVHALLAGVGLGEEGD